MWLIFQLTSLICLDILLVIKLAGKLHISWCVINKKLHIIKLFSLDWGFKKIINEIEKTTNKRNKFSR